MNKKVIRLTESDLHRIVKETANKMLREMEEDPFVMELRDFISDGSQGALCNISFDERSGGYRVVGTEGDYGLWAHVLFAVVKYNLKVVASGSIQNAIYVILNK